MAYARRTDGNHSDVIGALRQSGWYVCDTSRLGNGFFDAIAVKHGLVRFIEIKDGSKPPSARKLTKDEAEMHVDFINAGAHVVVLESVEDIAWLNLGAPETSAGSR